MSYKMKVEGSTNLKMKHTETTFTCSIEMDLSLPWKDWVWAWILTMNKVSEPMSTLLSDAIRKCFWEKQHFTQTLLYWEWKLQELLSWCLLCLKSLISNKRSKTCICKYLTFKNLIFWSYNSSKWNCNHVAHFLRNHEISGLLLIGQVLPKERCFLI